jgi:hypothetical protein
MFLFSLIGIRWSVSALAVPLLVLSVFGWMRWRGSRTIVPRSREGTRPALALATLALLLSAYAAGTARATSTDLLLFWGSKAARFAAAGGIDLAFLGDAENRFIHPDYPPLQTFLFAWAALVSGRFPWGAALLTMPFFLALAALAFWGLARESLESARAAELTAILTALLSFTCVASLSAGNAEPLLLFFETLALSAIVFGRGRRSYDVILALGLAGAAWTKIEGAAFAALAVACFAWLNRRGPRIWWRLLQVAGPAAALLASWLVFAGRHRLLQGYIGETYGPFSMERWRTVLSETAGNAGYGAFYLPWVVVLILWAMRRRNPGAGAFLAAAGAFLLFVLFSYLREGFDPTAWIRWSAPRLLMTPLLFLFFAGPGDSGQTRSVSLTR